MTEPKSNPVEALHITPTAGIAATTHGGRAKCLQRLIRLDLPVPETIAVSFDAVHLLAEGVMPDLAVARELFGPAPLLCVRPSSEDPDWGGPEAVLNIGMNDAKCRELAAEIGAEAADLLYFRFIQSFATGVARLEPDYFDAIDAASPEAIGRALDAYADEMDAPFPQDPWAQLSQVLRSMARAWEGTSARLLRQARGAPLDAGLGLIVQRMALSFGRGECGAGVIQFTHPITGAPQITGRYRRQSQGREALLPEADALYLTSDPRGPSLEEMMPEAFRKLEEAGGLMRARLREELQIEFTLTDGVLSILDALPVTRSARGAVRIVVDLAEDGVISRDEALLRIEPAQLTELLHRQVDPRAVRDLIGRGIAASPGAASGPIVFSANEAQAAAARGETPILVRSETSPEDIRGMNVAAAVLTERGGMTSHAAVIGRGLGLPCVVGASSISFRTKSEELHVPGRAPFRAGDIITVDGSSGEILAGRVPMHEPMLDTPFQTLLGWADARRDIAVRANADTPSDARTARNFRAQGIGLCRTEHMFFDADRLTAMREMIFADTAEGKRAALERILPMQRDDFVQIFDIMAGHPVCIRLFDPPLHEFLPTDRAGLRDLAEALDLPLADVTRRAAQMREYNPMLGLRGVRLGITVPEIYDMQARAIFEATIEASDQGSPVVPEIMIPLVSSKREVELVKTRIEAVAAAVRNETGKRFRWRLGVMVETPRAALRAEEIAQFADFLSFGTNDLTQMTYGLSRDDAGRFMSEYVRQGVFPEDPFHVLDPDGVGELLHMGAERGRKGRGDITLSICGEHGGTPSSIALCRRAGFDYVSCSPFRVPVARLAAAQLAIRDER